MTSFRKDGVDLASAHLAAIVRSSNDAIVSKSIAGIVRTWNAAAERMFGYSAEEIVGRSIRILIPEDRQQEEDDILERIGRNEEVTNFETVRLRKDGVELQVSVTVSPIHDDQGAVVGASKIVRDISEQVATRARLRESEERFRDLADNVSQLTWMADRDGYIFWYNQRWYDYTGATLDEMKGWGWRQAHHPDHLDRVVERIQHSWNTGEPWEDTFPLRRADGEYRWFLSRALPIRDESGEIVRWFGSSTDITEQKQSEERIKLLMAEVNHRSKNLLALVQSIARQTAGDDDALFLERFSARLQSLAASQDVLVGANWGGADLRTTVSSQLAYFSDMFDDRIVMDGPSVFLSANAAQTLGLALHELATNAAKYGALSNEVGTVRVAWRLHGSGPEGQRFSIEWTEAGGPQVAPPSHRGFGSIVIEQMSEMALGARVDFDFRPEGLRWRLACRGNAALASRGAAPPRVEATPRAANGPTGKRVLLVEDDAVIALDFMNVLENAGYRVVGPAASVDHALKLMLEYRCDVAVLDVNLGSETSEPIAVRLAEAKTPFITVSAYAADQQPAALREAPHLSKPLNSKLLLQFLDQHCVEEGERPN